MTVKTYDSRVYELAALFLEDEERFAEPAAMKKACHELALHLQQEIEDWCKYSGYYNEDNVLVPFAGSGGGDA